MAFSINVNPGALNALRNLSTTNRELEQTQTRINTGLKIGSAKDNAAVYSIAQKLRGDVKGLNAVTQSLDRGISSVDVALAAANAISDLVLEMKERAVAAADEGLDTTSREALNEDFEALRDQITTIVNNADFNGTNLIDGGTDRVTAITNVDATEKISVAHQDLTLAGSIIAIGPNSTISSQTGATSVVASLTSTVNNLNSVLTKLGSGSTTLENNRIFAGKLQDVIEVGIGNLVDADLATESARLEALQVQQQLGVQALSIANQSPQTILSLFQ